MRRLTAFGMAFILVIALFGCTRTQKGGTLGAGAGALLGGLIGKASGNTAAGTIAGAAVGGAVGAHVGHYMDEQAKEMDEALANAKVERVDEGIVVTMDSGILFDVNKSDLRPAAKSELDKLSTVLLEKDKTNILVVGHTDSDGSDEYNLKLSEQRASSVRSYLVAKGVTVDRMTMQGKGEMDPVAPNDSPEGKQLNRRVEMIFTASDELIAEAEAAEKG
ncbi:MAG: OmpA family protein [Gemmatimonadetes bacterium]|nr:OmpA family protein [Gemmatimonadota bacterium]